MSQNEALLGELRKYLGSAQSNPQVKESEQVLALKHDLNLAARVGQQLLMQLQASEKQNKANELQLEQLKASNIRLAQENQRMAAEHELLSETLESQDAEIASLVQRLHEAMARSARLSKASQSARSLEKEVQLLEQIQSDLRTELEASTQRRDAAERLARNLAQHVASTYKDLRTEIGLPLEHSTEGLPSAPHDISNISHDTVEILPPDTVRTGCSSEPPELTNDTTDTYAEQYTSTGASTQLSANGSTDSLDVHPVDMATPLRPYRPKLQRSLSHESVLSLAPPAPLFKPLIPLRQPDTTIAPKALTALSGQHSFTASTAGPRTTGVSARDRLSQIAPERKTRVATESRWHFTPFRR